MKNVNLDTKLDYWINGWELDIKCVDNAGNVFSRTKSFNGVVDDAWDAVSNLAGTIVDFGQWIWNKATGAAAKAADRVADLATDFVDWAKGEISSMFSNVVDPIVDGLKDWAKNVAKNLVELFSELNKWKKIDGDESVTATKSQGIEFVMSLVGLQDKAERIESVMREVSDFASPFLEYIGPFGVTSLFGEAFGQDIGGLNSYFEDIKNGIAGGISTMISSALNLFVGDQNSLISALGISNEPTSREINHPSLNALNNFISHSDALGDEGIASMVFEKLEIESGPVGEVSNAMLVILGVISISIFSGMKCGKLILDTGSYMIDATSSLLIEIIGLVLTIVSSSLEGIHSLLASLVGSAWTTFWYVTSIDDYIRLIKDWPVGTILMGLGTGEVLACYSGLASYF